MSAGAGWHVVDEGAGAPAVAFLHGFGLDGDMWLAQRRLLRHRHRLLSLDFPGFGRTPPVPDPRAASVDGWADEVVRVVEERGVAPVVLVGLSLGGYVAMAVLRRRPDVVMAAVLADTQAEPDAPDRRARREEQQARVVRGEDLGPAIDWYAEMGVARGSPRSGEAAERFRAGMLATSRAGWLGALEAMKLRPDATPALSRVTVPVLVVVGGEDRLTPPGRSRAIAAGVPGARLVELPGVGHLSNLEDPEPFNEALEAFLAPLRAG